MDTIKAAEAAPAAALPPVTGVKVGQQLPDAVVSVTPTQVRRPWRSTVRSTFQALVALAVLAPILVQSAGLAPDSLPWLAIPLGIAAALTRIMATPQVEEFLRAYLPFLAAAPAPHDARRRNDRGVTDTMLAVVVVLAVVILFILFYHR